MAGKYVSDYEQFLEELKRRNPAIEEGQRRGRSIFWDRRADPDEWRRYRESEIAQPAYVYQNYVGPAKDAPAEGEAGDPRTPGTSATNKS